MLMVGLWDVDGGLLMMWESKRDVAFNSQYVMVPVYLNVFMLEHSIWLLCEYHPKAPTPGFGLHVPSIDSGIF